MEATTPMALSLELKEILVCPACKGDVEFKEAQGEIICPRCRLVFSIEDDVPNMLLDDAKPLDD